MKKIGILTCYYGDFPWYFPYFIHSCKYNPTVDFIIISDNNYEYELPNNVTVINIPWEEIKELISRKLDLNIQLEFPYKLCDFKPAYGHIFPELLSKFDFWGHGDIDVIFGNIRNFITNVILENHDLICVRHDFLTGYFTLFRNCKKMNGLYKHSEDYVKVFTSPRHYCFDETNFTFEPFTEGIPFEEIHTEIDSMTHVVKRLHSEKYINAYFDFHVIEGNPGRLKWKNGILTFRNKFEIILYHMVRFKTRCKPTHMKKIPNTFYISPTRIYK